MQTQNFSPEVRGLVKQSMKMSTGFIWLRTGASGGLMWT